MGILALLRNSNGLEGRCCSLTSDWREVLLPTPVTNASTSLFQPDSPGAAIMSLVRDTHTHRHITIVTNTVSMVTNETELWDVFCYSSCMVHTLFPFFNRFGLFTVSALCHIFMDSSLHLSSLSILFFPERFDSYLTLSKYIKKWQYFNIFSPYVRQWIQFCFFLSFI
jgi:hypothetical protein